MYNFYCCCKGNSLGGIDIWSGAAYNELKSCFDNSFVASDFDSQGISKIYNIKLCSIVK